MKVEIYKSNERGYADHGWLKAKYSFSFAGYYDTDRIHFGTLRVLNNDIIEPGEGFGTHPHDNMEIVTIPLSGGVAHKDSHGHEEIIRPNDVQVMSAGTGIYHSEYNASQTEQAELLQIWVFPDRKGHEPRYDQTTFDTTLRKNQLHTFVSPNKNGENLWLNQDAYFSWTELSAGGKIEYYINTKGNGVFVFVIEGSVKFDNYELNKRDAAEITGAESFSATAEKDSYILFIEIPMD